MFWTPSSILVMFNTRCAGFIAGLDYAEATVFHGTIVTQIRILFLDLENMMISRRITEKANRHTVFPEEFSLKP